MDPFWTNDLKHQGEDHIEKSDGSGNWKSQLGKLCERTKWLSGDVWGDQAKHGEVRAEAMFDTSSVFWNVGGWVSGQDERSRGQELDVDNDIET